MPARVPATTWETSSSLSGATTGMISGTWVKTLWSRPADPNTVAGGPKMPHCSEAWDAIARYIYTGLQGGSIMKGWMNQENTMIACCSDGTRPVIFKIERVDEAD